MDLSGYCKRRYLCPAMFQKQLKQFLSRFERGSALCCSVTWTRTSAPEAQPFHLRCGGVCPVLPGAWADVGELAEMLCKCEICDSLAPLSRTFPALSSEESRVACYPFSLEGSHIRFSVSTALLSWFGHCCHCGFSIYCPIGVFLPLISPSSPVLHATTKWSFWNKNGILLSRQNPNLLTWFIRHYVVWPLLTPPFLNAFSCQVTRWRLPLSLQTWR